MRGSIRRALGVALALAVAGCTPGGGGGGSGGGGEGGVGGEGGGGADAGTPAARPPARMTEESAATLAHGAAIGTLARLAADPAFDASRMGDPAVYLAAPADTPDDPTVFASVYYQSSGLAPAFEGSRDRRPGVAADDDAGARLTSRIATGIQLGAVDEGAPERRGSARWHALQSARRLDAYTLYVGWQALDERSAAGFDRFVGLLWTADGAPQGTGARLAAIDALCGTDHLDRVARALGGARGPFQAALDAFGQLDPLDRRVIEYGESPEYDAAIEVAIRHVLEGLAVGLVSILRAPLDTHSQAEALGALDVIAADLRAADPMALDQLAAGLDLADPASVDVETLASLVTLTLEVEPCP